MPKAIINEDIQGEAQLPTRVKTSQNEIALTAIIIILEAETAPVAFIPTIIAKINIPSTSSTTAPPNIVTPSLEFNSPKSPKTLAVIPTEVAVIIAPTKRPGINSFKESKDANPNIIVPNKPSKNGNTTPPTATKVADPMLLKNLCLFVSNPASNNKITAPTFAKKYND